jgi:uncharacterized membrane protein
MIVFQDLVILKTYKMKKILLPLVIIFLGSCSESEVPIDNGNIDPQLEITYEANVKQIINGNCISCHSGTSPQGNLLLTTYDNVKNVGESGKLITRMNSTSNPMPPSGILPSSTRNVIDKWKEDGFLEN